MKFFALKYKVTLGIISTLFVILDLFLISIHGFEGQLLIFMYVMIAVVPLCGFIVLCNNMFVPRVVVDINCRTISADWIVTDIYMIDKRLRNQGYFFHFDEISNCEIDNTKIYITLTHGQIRTLYLGWFSKNQIRKIQEFIFDAAIKDNKLKGDA